LTFRLAPEFEVDQFDFPNGHRELRVKCRLSSIVTGAYQGSGLGSCSTMESKYRYRSASTPDEPTDVVVPRDYWDRKKQGAAAGELQAILAKAAGGPGRYGTKKIDDVWIIVKKGERTEERVDNPDLADQYNTVLKMATKRALVAAVLIVTAASDIFTQDIEENPEALDGKPAEAVREEVKAATEKAGQGVGKEVPPQQPAAKSLEAQDAELFKNAPKPDDGAAYKWVEASLDDPFLTKEAWENLKAGCLNRRGEFWTPGTKDLFAAAANAIKARDAKNEKQEPVGKAV
jgi:hypothetical protein